MLGGQYIIFVDKKWNYETKQSYSNLKYYNIKDNTTHNLTEESTTQLDGSPIVSDKYNDTVFFLRTINKKTHIYYISINQETVSKAVQLSNYPLNIANIKIKGDTLVFSTGMYYECKTMNCTAQKNEEVAKRGDHTYMEYTKLMVRHWDTWYTEGKADHPFYQKIAKEGNNYKLINEPIDMLLNQEASSPPIEGGSNSFSISEDESKIAFMVHQKDRTMAWNTKWNVYIYDTINNNYTVITNNEEGRCQNPKFSNKNSDLIAYFCMPRKGLESDQLHLRVYDLKEHKNIDKTYNESYINFPKDFYWIDDNSLTFYFISSEKGHIRIYLYDHKSKTTSFTLLTNDDNAYKSIFYYTSDKIYVLYSSWLFPEVIGTLTKTDNIWKSNILVNLNEKELDKYEFSVPESFEFNCTLNDTCQAWIMKPIKFKNGTKYPLSFLIHGGPESSWDPSWSFRWNPQNWVNREYGVLMINPHGSLGCGIKFQDDVRNNWGSHPFEDLMIGWNYLKEKFSDWVNMDKIGACGASYGGYMINWIQGHNNDSKFKCLVDHDGAFNTMLKLYTTDEIWFPLSEFCPIDKLGCKTYDDEYRDNYQRYNPEAFVQNWKTPQLIIQGSKDFRIPLTEGVSAFAALQMRKVPSKFIHFPDENHWVLKPDNSIKWYQEVLDWLDIYLKK